MDDRQREIWNARVPTVTVRERCDECGLLKEGVKKRQNYWPTISATCCAECFTNLIGEAQGYVAC
jgi:hypothetical protein